MATRNNNSGLATLDYEQLAYASDYKVSAEESAAFAKVVVANDLSTLNDDEQVVYYFAVSRMAGLNPLNRPFEILEFDNGKRTMYATKRAADELRFNHKLTTRILEREEMMDGQMIRVTAQVEFPDGRSETADAIVPLVTEEKIWKKNQNGKSYPELTGNIIPMSLQDRANALMKAETKAKRRATLSAVGLGMLDETETETIPRTRHATVDISTGEIKSKPHNPAQLTSTSNVDAAMAALHAAAGENDISHNDLKTIAVKSWNYTSLTDAKASELANLAEKIRANPQGARAWIEQLKLDDDDVVEGSATVVDGSEIEDPAVRSAQRDIWEIAVESYGWTGDQLEAVCQNVLSTGYRQANAEQLNKLYADLVSADEEARSEYLKAA